MTVLVIGMSNENSLGFKIASACDAKGISTILTSRRRKFIDKLSCKGYDVRYLDYPSDCSSLAFMPSLSGVVFCLAKTDLTELRSGLIETSSENFHNTLVTSCYSLIDVIRQLKPFLENDGSIIALTFFGSSSVVPGYGLMGIAKAALEQTVRTLACEMGADGVRFNCISSGPLPTISARSLHGFSQISRAVADRSCLRRGVDSDEIAAAALWLLSRESSGVTGEVLNVNCGIRHRLRDGLAIEEVEVV